jgi:glycosyltransferase involved in cell wall biosynthesis
MSKPDVIVGAPICRRTAFALDKFLDNQREIQQAYPGGELVLATEEPDFVDELKERIVRYHLRGDAIAFELVRPANARHWAWAVAGGREAIRKYALSRGVDYLLCFDSDMTYDPSVISIMKEKIRGFDVVSSGYRLPRYGAWGFGGGCVLINRKTLNKIKFRCYEFKSGFAITEDEWLDVDLFSCRARVKKGIFVPIRHYTESGQYYAIKPQPVGWLRRLANRPLVRYILVRMSVLFGFNIAGKLHILFYRKRVFLSSGPS